jgi:hypothetical protein
MAQPQPSPWASVAPDNTPPPALAPVQMPDAAATPQVFAPSAAPSVKLAPQPPTPIEQQVFAPSAAPSVKLAPQPPTPIEQQVSNDQQRLEKVRWEQANPWGTPENHPGKLGKLAHVFSTLGNIAGDVFAPTVMANIPGTQMNRGLEEHGLAKRLNSEISQQSQEAYQGAETGKTQEETAEMPGKTQSEEGLQGAQSANLQSETAARNAGPDLATAYAHAVNQAIKNGADPSTDPVVQHLSDAITAIQKPLAPKGKDHVNLQDASGRPYAGTFDQASGKYYDQSGKEIANPIPYEKPISVNAGDASLDREASRLAKPYEKGVADANAQLEKIADAKTMINGSAEAQALGVPKVLTALVSGQGSGVRITQPELNAIAKARGLEGDLEGTLNSWSGKGKLTATQQQQLSGILDDVQQRILAKQAIHSAALDSINGAASRADIIKADKEARQKINDLEKSGGANHSGGMIRALDPQGVLHEAPAGTALPAGWKAQ